jgi:CheY-like chemotaxis protein
MFKDSLAFFDNIIDLMTVNVENITFEIFFRNILMLIDFSIWGCIPPQSPSRKLERQSADIKGQSVDINANSLSSQILSPSPLRRMSDECEAKTFSELPNFKVISPQAALQAHTSSPDIVGVFSGTICNYITPAVHKQLGYEVEEWIGKSFLEFVHPKDRQQTDAFCQKISSSSVANENIHSLRIRLIHKNHERPSVNFELVFFSPTGTFNENPYVSSSELAKGVSFRNIDAEVAQSLENRTNAHDEANTLGAAEQLFEIINEKMTTLNVDPEIEKLFHLAQAQVAKATNRCKKAIKANEKQGALEVQNRPTNLYEELSTFAQINIEMQRKSDIEFRYEIDAQLKDEIVNMDFVFLSTVLENFVKNSKRSVKEAQRAVKYVSMTVRVLKDLANTSKIYFAIQDSGTGFDNKNFTRQTHAQVFSGNGSPVIIDNGLGLLRSVQKIQALGGELLITSDTANGSALEFTLVFKKMHQLKLPDSLSLQRSAPASLVQYVGDASKVFRILIVEDVELNTKLLKRKFEKYNTTCILAKNGQEAVEACEKEKFDIILMDFEMPVLDGRKATAQIRASMTGLNQQTQIWGLTGDCTDTGTSEGTDAGMNQVLTKPLDMFKVGEFIVNAFPNCQFVERTSHTPMARDRIPTT